MKRIATVPLLALFLLSTTGAAPASSTGDYISRLRSAVEAWQAELPALEKSASVTAAKVVSGGHLYAAGPQKSFFMEACGRSGGLDICRPLLPETVLGLNDTVLAGTTQSGSADELKALLQKAQSAGASVILFSGSQRPQGDHLIIFPENNFARPHGDGPQIESVSNVIGMWAWTGELVRACVRLGKMPCLYESVSMPQGQKRDEAVRNKSFHDHNLPNPQAVPDLGRNYLTIISASLSRLEEKNRGSFSRATALLKDSHLHNRPVFVRAMAHMFPDELTSNPVPAWFQFAPSTTPPGPGDVTIYLGYQTLPWEIPALTVGERVPCIMTSSRRPTLDWVEDATHVYIDPCWEVQDAAVKVPGYDINILPPSGVMQSAIFWQLIESCGERKTVSDPAASKLD